MISIKYSQLITLEPVFEKMSYQHLPVRTLYKISKLQKAVTEEMDFYRDKIRAIIETYSEKDESGRPIQENGNVRIIPDQIAECNSKIEELLAVEVELPELIFTLDELDKLDLALDDFNKLMPFIEE